MQRHIQNTNRVLDPSRKRNSRTLTPYGVVFLAKTGNMKTKITGAAVRDRSKAGRLEKFIVVIQVNWLVLQVFARALSGLTMALLEVHVILHVLCSIAMYLT